MTRSKLMAGLAGSAAAALIALSLAACGGGNGATAASAPNIASGHTATVRTANQGSLGTILIDSKGRTLYLFRQDKGTKSQCSGPCTAIWPPLRATGKPTAGDGANASRIGTTTRSDGKPQVTYNGHPVYLYSGDQKPGDTNGQGLTDFGASWYVLSAAGDQVSGHPSSTGGGIY